MARTVARSCVIACALAAATMALAPPASGQPAPSAPAVDGFAVYMLSRGRGVPDATRRAYEEAKAVLEAARDEGRTRTLTVEVVGLEGERRLCVEFLDPVRAQVALARIEAIAAGVELLNVIVEPCATGSGGNP